MDEKVVEESRVFKGLSLGDILFYSDGMVENKLDRLFARVIVRGKRSQTGIYNTNCFSYTLEKVYPWGSEVLSFDYGLGLTLSYLGKQPSYKSCLVYTLGLNEDLERELFLMVNMVNISRFNDLL